ncbi:MULTISPECIES: cytochrome P460 family protein [Paraburkholderia]|uniref:Cytochrome P460 family protein n=1 Tax=Paraburkholderia madseniana TaxID=2599607 RepID=A0AAP5EST8_9BURK|nr:MULTISPECIES: cytochrome P460 family protein [Paraburkholderia]MCX4151533.1 cytochrome P460 family protein [Paraburkholderia madseniana]MDN7154464.1 cytochrome P460 family protein [Paraburkholderia sp. WS6]MDQ6413346.1 cytochrome P460 family protein [Paraburkholderia madseniana]
MRRTALMLMATMALAGGSVCTLHAATDAGGAYVSNDVTLPAGYREWTLISVAREEGKIDDLRAILGNEAAIKTLQESKYPIPNGAIIARLAWSYDELEESAKAFGQSQSHVAGHPKNGVQFMVKDATKYASTGGWGYAQFDPGKSYNTADQHACFACHSVVKNRDFVFNRFAPDLNGTQP